MDIPASSSAPSSALREPSGFSALFLTIATALYQDIHVNLSGAVLFLVYGCAIFRPDLKDQCNQLAMLAGTYLFAAAKRK